MRVIKRDGSEAFFDDEKIKIAVMKANSDVDAGSRVTESDACNIADNVTIIRIAADTIRVCARPSKGVTVMKLAEGAKVVTIARSPNEDKDDISEEGEQNADESGSIESENSEQ